MEGNTRQNGERMEENEKCHPQTRDLVLRECEGVSFFRKKMFGKLDRAHWQSDGKFRLHCTLQISADWSLEWNEKREIELQTNSGFNFQAALPTPNYQPAFQIQIPNTFPDSIDGRRVF